MTNSDHSDQDSAQGHIILWSVTWKFNDESFEFLRTCAEELEFPKGARIFDEGDPADGMYLILSGSVIVFRRSAGGEQKLIGMTQAGQSFGELALLVEQPRRASVAAYTDLKALKITPYVLSMLEKNAPDIALMMYRELARSLAAQLVTTRDMQRPD